MRFASGQLWSGNEEENSRVSAKQREARVEQICQTFCCKMCGTILSTVNECAH